MLTVILLSVLVSSVSILWPRYWVILASRVPTSLYVSIRPHTSLIVCLSDAVLYSDDYHLHMISEHYP